MAELIGRFHPLIVHLPIGIIVLAFLMELASRVKSYAYLKTALPFVLQMAIATSFVALLSGWVMPKEGAFDEILVGRHFWSSVSFTGSVVLVYVLQQTKRTGLQRFYFPMFLITMTLLSVAGHYGGSLTHGADHLTKSLEAKKEVRVKDVNTLAIYASIIAPILQKKCNSCHNEGKQKGGLVTSTPAGLQKGGDGGKVIQVGNANNGVLIQRLHLPLEAEEHMPPEGKVQLNKNEIQLLEWWITEGADFEQKVGQVHQPESIKSILKGYQSNEQAIDISKLKAVSSQDIDQFSAAGIQVMPLSENNPLVYVNLSRDTLLTKGKLKRLKSIAKNITDLDLSFSNVHDELLPILVSFKNLSSLKLQQTAISSKGIEVLTSLKHLKSLNVYATKIDDTAFASFQKMTALNTLYLWQTQTSKQKIKDFVASRPLVKVNYEIDQSMFGDARLKPPSIHAAKDFFEDTLRVDLQLNFKNVDLYYTLDGSQPDSTSTKYTHPFLIDQSTTVKAISAKKGWKTSEANELTFIKAGYKVEDIRLSKAPNKKYKAKGAKSLIDFEKGSISFSDGKWLGYEGEHLTVKLDLGKSQPISSVTVGTLEDTQSYIFFPKKIVVATSSNGRSFVEQTFVDIPTAQASHPSEVKSFLLGMDDLAARYVQVKIFGNLKNPEWHAAPGAKNWIFLDEIIIN